MDANNLGKVQKNNVDDINSLEESINNAKHEQAYVLSLVNGLNKLKRIFLRSVDKKEIKYSIKHLNSLYIKSLEENNSILKENKRLEETLSDNIKAMRILIHDVNSPIGNLMQLSEFMVTEYAEIVKQHPEFAKNEFHDVLNLLEKNSKSLYETIGVYNKWIDSNKRGFSLKCDDYNINKLIAECCSDFSDLKTKADRKGVILNYAVVADNGGESTDNKKNNELNVFTDKNLIYIAINNLVSNSIKFTPSGKNVYVAAEPLDDEYVKVTVRDEGAGIPEDIKDKLFLVEGITNKGTNGEEGSGTGLNACSDYVKKQGGNIGIEKISDHLHDGTDAYFIYFTIPRYSMSKKIIDDSLKSKD